MYSASWCSDCRRANKFIGEQFIPYRWVDIEQDKDGQNCFLQRNNGKRIIPLILFEDDSFLVEPRNAELARQLGLKTEAIYASREGADVLLIERSGLAWAKAPRRRSGNF